MARKYMDIAFSAGKYTGSDGKERTRWQPGGRLMVEDDGKMWGLIEFLGLSLKFSVFEQKPKTGETQSAAMQSSAAGRAAFDDDIPF